MVTAQRKMKMSRFMLGSDNLQENLFKLIARITAIFNIHNEIHANSQKPISTCSNETLLSPGVGLVGFRANLGS